MSHSIQYQFQSQYQLFHLKFAVKVHRHLSMWALNEKQCNFNREENYFFCHYKSADNSIMGYMNIQSKKMPLLQNTEGRTQITRTLQHLFSPTARSFWKQTSRQILDSPCRQSEQVKSVNFLCIKRDLTLVCFHIRFPQLVSGLWFLQRYNPIV